ncbi:MAG: ATP-binding protein [Spirochaetales bacterium]|nr:ATP-binding protein [Spirochaetales bacterium]
MINWDYSLADAIQLMIPILCAFLSAATVIVYLFLYRSFKYKNYYAGFLISLGAFTYVFFEALVITSGWVAMPRLGRIFHFLGQLSAVYFLYSMMLFASTLTHEEGRISRVSVIMGKLGLGMALLITFISILFPDLFLSLKVSAEYGYQSLGDIGRGKEGPLYSLRDFMLGIYISTLIIISITSLFIRKGDKNTLLVVIGTLFAAISAIDDISFFHFNHNFILNSYRFSRLSVGLAVMNFLIMTTVLRGYIQTQDSLNSTHLKLQAAHNKLSSSEMKYRKLAEGTEYAVFSLSRDFKFQSFNRKARIYFNLNSHNLVLPLPVILGQSADNNEISRQIVEENLRQLCRDKESVTFHSTLQDSRTGEPEELEFHIEYYESEDGDVEYICRAEKMKAQRLIKSIEQESLQLNIKNYIIAIDEVTTRLTAVLRKHLDEGTVLMVKMGLQELIINAIEHGNLNISFDEKSRAMKEKRYLDFLRERQSDPSYRDRTVRIDYVLDPEKVSYTIRDDGEGFNYRDTMTKVEERVEQDFLPHGRGIRMAETVFDSTEYNEKGNQVRVIKEF